jgi:hypothetical protein
MQLAECESGDVVQNQANRNFYRYERPESDRSRIRPLELFPNGLLVAKPTDTIVEADLLVRFVARWQDPLFVQVQPGDARKRRTCEIERERKMTELAKLQAEAEVIDPKQRGSHANKVKAVITRLDALNRGLMEAPDNGLAVTDEPMPPRFQLKQVVQLPSGAAAMFMGSVQTSLGSLATVRNAVGSFHVAPEVLAPIEHRWMSTVG